MTRFPQSGRSPCATCSRFVSAPGSCSASPTPTRSSARWMMLGHGDVGGKRILSRPAVEAMTVDHLTAEQKARSAWLSGYWETHGWGFGMMIVTRRFDIASTPGKFGWDGGLGTSWRADPGEQMTTILLTPVGWTSPSAPDVFRDFWTLAYSAIDD